MYIIRPATLAIVAALCFSAGAAAAPPQVGSEDPSRADVDGPFVTKNGADGWISKRLAKHDNRLAVMVEKVAQATPEILVPLPGRNPLKVRLRNACDPPPDTYSAPERLFVFSDLEGNLAAMIELLRAGGVVDEDLKWTFGTGHLVFVGDLFDRGLHVTECAWLFYELAARAEVEGGLVHFIMGNHELMNFTGDLRYVRNKYRENAALLGVPLAELHPKESVLGRWLRTRNLIERIGDVIFVHGGISPTVAQSKYTVRQFNESVHLALFPDPERKPERGPLVHAVGDYGLFWYRGYIAEPTLREPEIEAILNAMAAKCVVVGHTLVPAITFLHGGRILAVDVNHAAGNVQAALRVKDAWFRVFPGGKQEAMDPR